MLNYCCCYDLKSGTLVIGILILIIDLLTIIYAGIFYCIEKGILETYYPIQNKNINDSQVLIIFSVGLSVIFLTLLMILGSWKNKFKYMLPYLIVKCICMVMGFIFFWYVIVTNFIANTLKGCLYLFSLNAATVIAAYFWLVVYSRSKEILMENKTEKGKIRIPRRIMVMAR